MAKSNALIHVQLNINFHFLLASVSDVALELLNLVDFLQVLLVQIPHFALQIDHQVGVVLQGAAYAVCSKLSCLGR